MEKYERMTLIQFQKQYSTEEACQARLFNTKWPEAISVKDVAMWCS